jgi:hypothetical protein
LSKNYTILKNTKLKNFDDLKKKPKFPCIYCGECFPNNFELAVHRRSNQCLKDSEQICSFCLKLNTKDHKSIAYSSVECVVCSVKVKGIIYHSKTIDHTPYITQFGNAFQTILNWLYTAEVTNV